MSSSREEESEIGAAETVEESEQAALDTAEVDLPMETSAAIAAAPDKSSSSWLTASGTVDRSGEETARRTSDSKETVLAGTTKSGPKTGKGTTEPNKKEKKFPWILHKIIDEAEHEGNEHIVAWMPNGRSFIVHKRDTFTEQILPKYFRQTKYKSFVRQLNLWGFTYIDQGPEKGSCTSRKKDKNSLRTALHALRVLVPVYACVCRSSSNRRFFLNSVWAFCLFLICVLLHRLLRTFHQGKERAVL